MTTLEEHVAREWRCFHCDKVFTTIKAAREHFGPHELADPACQIDIAKFREMERYYQRCLAEDSDSERAWHAKSAEHARALLAEEQKGFDCGLKAQLETIPHDRDCPYCARAAIAAVRGWEGRERLPSQELMESAARFAAELASDGGSRDLAVSATRACMDNLGLTPRRIDPGPAPDPAEAMRAKCEAIAREEAEENDYTHRPPAVRIADAIAAIKGN